MPNLETIRQLAEINRNKQLTKDEPEANQQLAAKFQELLNLGAGDLDKAAKLEATGNDNELIKKLGNPDFNNNNKLGHSMSPLAALEGQRHITKAVIEVDLFAKIAGSLSQSINKLASMQ
ncbi:EscI/YscI/HrpB family type III secretion system inner rod protein [Parashewanella curva]|uniref:EscI/YscI/HrpB family type III secretion system inner rod protein n=1 Tax=Parashewanella curva TaxID=2338552 RepID=A0A3L8PYW8_9GAMM|nr:type III secretion system inner rod subunit SctI [Parashewanella curva]RLV59783.1 EscI/YscI/HrpB family type III secretion system inner rod protein [Parashewanella curva]